MERELEDDCEEADEDDGSSSDLSWASTGSPLFSPISSRSGDGRELGGEGGGPSKLRLANDDKGRLPTSLRPRS